MNLIELSRALHQLRLGGMVAALETRLLQAQTANMAPIDILSILVSDEIACRSTSGCWNGARNRLASAIPTSAWTTSISSSTPR